MELCRGVVIMSEVPWLLWCNVVVLQFCGVCVCLQIVNRAVRDVGGCAAIDRGC